MNKAGMRLSFMTVWEATTQLFAAPRGIFPVTFALTALLHSHVYSKSDFDLQLCEWMIDQLLLLLCEAQMLCKGKKGVSISRCLVVG